MPMPKYKAVKHTRKITYNVEAIQGGIPNQQRTWREAYAIKNQAAINAAIGQTGIPNMRSMYQWGERYTKGMVGYNAYPQAVASLTNRPLQALINRGSPNVQKAILHAVGVKPGLGAARIVDEMVRGGVKTVIGPGGAPIAGGISRWPALEIGAGYLFKDAPVGAVNTPENRPQWQYNTGGQPASFQPQPQGWSIGR